MNHPDFNSSLAPFIFYLLMNQSNFRPSQVSDLIGWVLEKTSAELRSREEGLFRPWQDFFDHYRIVRKQGLIFSIAMSERRPIEQIMIVVKEDSGRVFLPGIHHKDFFEVVNMMGLETLDEKVTFLDFCHFNYGVFVKGNPSQPIQGASDAQKWGFELKPAWENKISPFTSLWWQKWGGILRAVTFRDKLGEHEIKREILEEPIGRCKALPYSEFA